jgi:hypothetical protein
VQLPDAVAEVLHESVSQPHELAQLVGGRLGQPCRRRPLLRGEVGDAERVDSIGLGARAVLAGEAPRAQRVEQHRGEAPNTWQPASTANRFFQQCPVASMVMSVPERAARADSRHRPRERQGPTRDTVHDARRAARRACRNRPRPQ